MRVDDPVDAGHAEAVDELELTAVGSCRVLYRAVLDDAEEQAGVVHQAEGGQQRQWKALGRGVGRRGGEGGK